MGDGDTSRTLNYVTAPANKSGSICKIEPAKMRRDSSSPSAPQNDKTK